MVSVVSIDVKFNLHLLYAFMLLRWLVVSVVEKRTDETAPWRYVALETVVCV